MYIQGIEVDNLENFKNTSEIEKLNIKLLLANHKRYRLKHSEDTLYFLDKLTSKIVYKIYLDDISKYDNEALSVAFNTSLKEEKYDIKFTCKPGDYVYALLPTMIDEGEHERFTFNVLDIAYLKVERLYGKNDKYALTDLMECRDNPRKIMGIPNIFCFQNISDAVTVCKITPDNGYRYLDEFIENCEKYIKYIYKADTGYDYKSVIPYEFLVNYDISGNTFTYGLDYDTDEDTAYTYTLPIAFNEVTGEIVKEIDKCRADSLGSDGINISINNEQIKIKRVKVKVSFNIEEI